MHFVNVRMWSPSWSWICTITCVTAVIKQEMSSASGGVKSENTKRYVLDWFHTGIRQSLPHKQTLHSQHFVNDHKQQIRSVWEGTVCWRVGICLYTSGWWRQKMFYQCMPLWLSRCDCTNLNLSFVLHYFSRMWRFFSNNVLTISEEAERVDRKVGMKTSSHNTHLD